jgi:hypothetical protein
MQVSDTLEADGLRLDPGTQREEFGRILGIDGPVTVEVMSAAVENDAYARNLLLCRRDPELLADLLRHPPRRRQDFGAAELAVRGSRALLRWAGTGFTTVDDATYARRLATCDACPDLVRADGGNPTCGRCGCRVRAKARMTSESCPVRSAEDPELTRWGDAATEATQAA